LSFLSGDIPSDFELHEPNQLLRSTKRNEDTLLLRKVFTFYKVEKTSSDAVGKFLFLERRLKLQILKHSKTNSQTTNVIKDPGHALVFARENGNRILMQLMFRRQR
jgi:hypothetical protein